MLMMTKILLQQVETQQQQIKNNKVVLQHHGFIVYVETQFFKKICNQKVTV